MSKDLSRHVENCINGNSVSYSHVVSHYQGAAYALAYSITGNHTQSEDLAQEAFILAWRKIGQIQNPSSFGSWLMTIVRNVSLDWLRREKKNRHVPLDYIARQAEAATEPQTAALCDTESAEAVITPELLWQTLKDIPEKYRSVMVLYYREEHSAKDIAEMLGISVSTVHQRLSRGRQLLKKEVAARVEDILGRIKPSPQFTSNVLSAIAVPAAPLAAGGAAAKSTGGSALTATSTGKATLLASLKAKIAAGTAAAVIAATATTAIITSDQNAPTPTPAPPPAIAAAAPEKPKEKIAEPKFDTLLERQKNMEYKELTFSKPGEAYLDGCGFDYSMTVIDKIQDRLYFTCYISVPNYTVEAVIEDKSISLSTSDGLEDFSYQDIDCRGRLLDYKGGRICAIAVYAEPYTDHIEGNTISINGTIKYLTGDGPIKEEKISSKTDDASGKKYSLQTWSINDYKIFGQHYDAEYLDMTESAKQQAIKTYQKFCADKADTIKSSHHFIRYQKIIQNGTDSFLHKPRLRTLFVLRLDEPVCALHSCKISEAKTVAGEILAQSSEIRQEKIPTKVMEQGMDISFGSMFMESMGESYSLIWIPYDVDILIPENHYGLQMLEGTVKYTTGKEPVVFDVEITLPSKITSRLATPYPEFQNRMFSMREVIDENQELKKYIEDNNTDIDSKVFLKSFVQYAPGEGGPSGFNPEDLYRYKGKLYRDLDDIKDKNLDKSKIIMEKVISTHCRKKNDTTPKRYKAEIVIFKKMVDRTRKWIIPPCNLKGISLLEPVVPREREIF